MKRLSFLIVLSFLFVSCKTEEKIRTVGYKGQARSDAFLAAQRYLEAEGCLIETRSGLGKINDTVSTIFLPPSTLNTQRRAKQVLKWVANGGHVVIMLDNGNKRGNDFHENDTQAGFVSDEDGEVPEESAGVEHVLEELGIGVVSSENEELEKIERDDWEKLEEKERALLNSVECNYGNGDEDYVVYQWSDKALVYDHPPEGYEDEYFYLTDYYGDGAVTLLTDASPLRNRYIAYGDHAAFLGSLVDMSRHGEVVFSSGAGDTLFSLIWQYFKIAVLSFALVIVFWLWKNLPRFGPEQDLPEAQMREFSSQLSGIGRFLWRHKRDDTMLTALRSMISRRLSLLSQNDHHGSMEYISQKTSLPVDVVTEAMTRGEIRDANVMVRVTQNLQTILKKIN